MILSKTFLFLLFLNSATTSVFEIRNLYEVAANNESASKRLSQLLKDVKMDNALLVGYKGAAIMVEANHVFNPFIKFKKFKQGKQLIENAIKLDHTNLELRYIRLTIQTNVPSFLGYSNAISTDKKILIKELGQLKDLDLRNRVINYLRGSKICTDDELKKIDVWKNK